MDSNILIPVLALVTLVMVIAYAIWQRGKVEKAKAEHHHSAITEGRPDQRATNGAPGVKPQ